MTINEKIMKLGVSRVAAECGVTQPAVSMWIKRGVPDVRLTQLKTLWPHVFGKARKASKRKGRRK